MFERLRHHFPGLGAGLDFCALRYVEERGELLHVRQGVEQPLSRHIERGAMITVIHRGGYGYAATSDCSPSGLAAAIARAAAWAEATRDYAVFDFAKVTLPRPKGRYSGPGIEEHPARRELIELMRAEADACRIDDRIVDWQIGCTLRERVQLYLTADGGDAEQRFRLIHPYVSVTAHSDGHSQTRTLAEQARQGGAAEVMLRLQGAGRRTAEEALELLAAPTCPSGVMDLLLMPEQMILQIHESIGHPLELDRILGDERNYAGTSFVTPDMFGHYRYGSPLLNVSYDPGVAGELASFGWDDDGTAAERTWIIKDGILLRPLGGIVSQGRAGLPGNASARASSWNRPPIDRMANLNLEPGTSTLDEMIASIDYGVMMDTNRSWSIDDSRNKFQFGCERGWLIENGKIKHLVKNPGYRGISATFWRSLAAVGNEATRAVLGTPYCGKGEPNQMIDVGHASPACLFRQVEVFGE